MITLYTSAGYNTYGKDGHDTDEQSLESFFADIVDDPGDGDDTGYSSPAFYGTFPDSEFSSGRRSDSYVTINRILAQTEFPCHSLGGEDDGVHIYVVYDRVFVCYIGVDSGGYDVENKLRIYNKDEFFGNMHVFLDYLK